MEYAYRMSEGVVLRADPKNLIESLQAWVAGEWTTYPWIDKDWIEGTVIPPNVAEAEIGSPDGKPKNSGSEESTG